MTEINPQRIDRLITERIARLPDATLTVRLGHPQTDDHLAACQPCRTALAATVAALRRQEQQP